MNKMNPKNLTLLLLIISCVFSASIIAMLAVAYFNNFPAWSTLCLLLSVALTICGWAFYYMARQKYIESITPKRKYFGKGNRRGRRKGN